MSDVLRIFQADYLLSGGELLRNGQLAIDSHGVIVKAGTGLGEPEQTFSRCFMAPGMVNSHSHAFQVLLRGACERSANFRDWVLGSLYPLVETITPQAIYESALLAFGEMLLEGVTSVGEFFYLNNLSEEPHEPARQILNAAEHLGIRLCLLRSLYDRGQHAAQARFKEPLQKALENARELSLEVRERGHGFGLAPHSLHGASDQLIRQASLLGQELGCPVHIHLAEQESDLEVARELYGTTPLKALEGLGAFESDLTCVHGVWLDAGEVQRMGQAGIHLAYNPRSNMALGDGITPVRDMLHAGVRISLGIDGPCANNQCGILHEVRAAEGLQRIQHRQMNQLISGSPWKTLLDMATIHGAQNLGLPCGSLQPGLQADFLVVDMDDLSLQPWTAEQPDLLLLNFLLSSSPRAVIRHVFVAGQQVVKDHRLCAALPSWASLCSHLPPRSH